MREHPFDRFDKRAGRMWCADDRVRASILARLHQRSLKLGCEQNNRRLVARTMTHPPKPAHPLNTAQWTRLHGDNKDIRPLARRVHQRCFAIAQRGSLDAADRKLLMDGLLIGIAARDDENRPLTRIHSAAFGRIYAAWVKRQLRSVNERDS